ncbi:MAG: hypothetical protein IKK63_03430 [Clostridia bacterium]|nr:hypothetical protein [Clostridia bacterium]
MDINMENINEILSSLSDEDMENLRAAAENLFSSEEKTEKKESFGFGGMPDLSNILGNARLMSGISSIMGAMNKTDSRTRLIEALKPLLSENRRRKADEAMQMMKLFELLPMLTNLMGGDNYKP